MRSAFQTSIIIVFILLLSACQLNNKPLNDTNINSKSDWINYNINEIIERSDLIAYVEVEETKNINGTPSYQESKLNIIQILKGDIDGESVTLNISDYSSYVTSGSKYLMFLTDYGTYYTQNSSNSIIKENNGEFNPTIDGLTGKFSIEEIMDKILK